MVWVKSADQLAKPFKYFSTSLAGLAGAAAAAIPPNPSAHRAITKRPIHMLFPRRRRTENLSVSIRLQRTHQTGRLHGFDQSSRAVIADLQTALHPRDGRLTRLGDDSHRLIVQRISFGIACPALTGFFIIRWEAGNRGARTFQ